jgi:hypothetical protein
MPTPDEIEAAAGIEPVDEVERKRIWAAAQAKASTEGRAPAADDLRLAEAMLDAAEEATLEHLGEGRGRAIITLTDTHTEGEFDVVVMMTPEPIEVSEDEVQATPAQAVAFQLLDALEANIDEHPHENGHDHGHSH